VSLIIPTYQRPTAIRCLLDALALQTLAAKGLFQVIVVDDGSPQPLTLDTSRWAGKFHLTLVRQGNRGPSIARNHGVDFADGEIIAFTDDDCLPQPRWLESIAREVKRHPESLVGTLTYNGLNHDLMAATSQFILELVYNHFNSNPEDAYFLASNNMACHRGPYLKLRGFGTSFIKPGAEDRDFCDRWRMTGRRIRLLPEPLLEHRHPQTITEFLGLHFRYGMGAYRYQAKRRSRKSGTMQEDLGFHKSLPHELWKCLPRQGGLLRQGLLCAGLVAWQLANASGFFSEAVLHCRRNPEASINEEFSP
jgi:glycosyltransferase involved in cell wall biosynthesis